MSRMRNALAAIGAVIVLAAGLTGCVNDEVVEGGYPLHYDVTVIEPSTVSINKFTGKITQYINPNGDVIFDEGASTEDTVVETYSYKDVEEGYFQTYDTVTVGGKVVQTTSSLHWTMNPGFNSIAYFNKYIASEDFDSVALLSSPNIDSIDAIVIENIKTRLAAALANGTLPRAQYTVVGEAFVRSNSLVAQAYAEGKEPLGAWSEIHNATFTPGRVNPDSFFYSFTCVSFEANVNYKPMSEAASALFGDANLVFEANDYNVKLRGTTSEPCSIIAPTNTDPNADNDSQYYDDPKDLFWPEYIK